MQNINRLLENSRRSDVRGTTIYSAGKGALHRPDAYKNLSQWDPPALGLPGIAAIGHHINVSDLLLPQIRVNGELLSFTALRHRWTPAFSDTYFRAFPSGEYTKSGLLAVREQKCFTAEDVFVSHLTLCNDDRRPMEVELSLCVPFEEIHAGVYRASADIQPRSLKKSMTLQGFIAAATDHGPSARLTIPPQSRISLRFGFAFSYKNEETACRMLESALQKEDVFADAEYRFNYWMEKNVPALHTDDIDMLKLYYYRFLVIKSAWHTPADVLPDSDYTEGCINESPFGAWFGAPVGLPVPLQIEELKWMKTPDMLRTHIQNWCDAKGVMQGYIQFTPMAIWNAYRQTGDASLLKAYESCARYTKEKCTEDPGHLPVTLGSWVTGAEYQPSFYQYTDPKWNWQCDTEGERNNLGYSRTSLYRVDECAMHAANLQACANMASILGKTEEADEFRLRAQETLRQLCRISWNEEKQFFFDVDVLTGKQCDEACCYDGFTPLMFALADQKYNSVFSHLAAGSDMDSGFSVPSVNKSCPMYWFDNCIAGPTASSMASPHPYGCCWNGPVWPFAVSLVLDALGSSAFADSSLQALWNRLFTEYSELHFHLGDRSTPCICEHYRPTDGLCFSPFTEYFHSEWIHLFLSHWAGIRTDGDTVTFRPFTESEFTLEGIRLGGKLYRFSQKWENGNRLCSYAEMESDSL